MKLVHVGGDGLTDKRIEEIAASVSKWLTEARDAGQDIEVSVNRGTVSWARAGLLEHAATGALRFVLDIGPDEAKARAAVPADADEVIGFEGP